MRQLSKAESLQRWSEARALWNEWDPIGVMDDPEWPRDEYEAYVGASLRLLEQGATTSEIGRYLKEALATMGLPAWRTRPFAKSLRSWFESNWHGTRS